jgi:predicted histidine transporter YuiF (NhaC family)
MAGLGLILLAVGAVLRYAVTAEASGVDLDMIGLILMATGAVGFLFGLFEGTFRSYRTERHVSSDGKHVVETTDTSGT